ncbi:MAG: hypothetical protein NTY19_28075 [Planctomycetota bacterium]|nr:hypothetical protein [Planctomycetota bacterium]
MDADHQKPTLAITDTPHQPHSSTPPRNAKARNRQECIEQKDGLGVVTPTIGTH